MPTDAAPTHSRRTAARLLTGGAGLCVAILLTSGRVRTVAQEDDDHDVHGGRGRGRGRGRGGDRLDTVPLLGEIPEGVPTVRIISDDAGGFSPGVLAIDAGDTIAFANTHDDEHTATGAGIDSGIIGPGAVVLVTLETPGEFRYACQFHPEMTGVIRVRDASGAVPVTAATAVTASDVSIASLAFSPALVAVAAGTTVTWTNSDAVPHTVTATDGSFDSGLLNPNDTFAFTFERPGTVDYTCLVHPSMSGTVEVGDLGAVTAVAAATPVLDAGAAQGLWSLFLSEGSAGDGYQVLMELEPDGSANATIAPTSATQASPTGAAHGAWSSSGARITVGLVALTINQDQTAAGTLRLNLELTLSGDDQLSGAWSKGADATPGGGTASGGRILLDPAP